MTLENAILFVDKDKVTQAVERHLNVFGIKIQHYTDFFDYLETLENQTVALDPNTNHAVYRALQDKNKIVIRSAPSTLMKAIKNESELAGFRVAMVRDGVALVKFFY